MWSGFPFAAHRFAASARRTCVNRLHACSFLAKDRRSIKIVLLIILNLQDTVERLRLDGKVSAQLQAAEVEIVVVPNLIDRRSRECLH